MRIEWNRVTWYSITATVIVFIGTGIGVFYFCREYREILRDLVRYNTEREAIFTQQAIIEKQERAAGFSLRSGILATIPLEFLIHENKEVFNENTELDSYSISTGISDVTFSPDGRRVAYLISRYTKPHYSVLIDGKEYGSYDDLLGRAYDYPSRVFIFSPQGDHLAYVAKRGNKYLVVVDGREDKSYDEIQDFQFDNRGSIFGYAARTGDQWFVVINDKEYGPYIGIKSSIVFSPDGSRWGYKVEKSKGKAVTVIDGNESQEHDNTSLEAGNIIFSRDGKRVAYIVKEDGQALVILDGQIHEPSRRFKQIYFQPDARTYQPIFGPHGEVFYYGSVGEKYPFKWYLVFGDEVIGPYDSLFTTFFSPKNELFFANVKDKKTIANFKGQETLYDTITRIQALDLEYYYSSVGNVTFSSDGSHVGFVAKKDGRTIVVIDHKEIGDFSNYEEIRDLKFDFENNAIIGRGQSGQNFFWISAKDGKVQEEKIKLAFESSSRRWTVPRDPDDVFCIENPTITACQNTCGESISVEPLFGSNREIAYFIGHISGCGHIFEKHQIVYRDKENTTYTFSTDEAVIPRHKFTSRGQLIYAASREFGTTTAMFINNELVGEYDYMTDFKISPDEKYLAFGARKGNQLLWIVKELK